MSTKSPSRMGRRAPAAVRSADRRCAGRRRRSADDRVVRPCFLKCSHDPACTVESRAREPFVAILSAMNFQADVVGRGACAWPLRGASPTARRPRSLRTSGSGRRDGTISTPQTAPVRSCRHRRATRTGWRSAARTPWPRVSAPLTRAPRRSSSSCHADRRLAGPGRWSSASGSMRWTSLCGSPWPG